MIILLILWMMGIFTMYLSANMKLRKIGIRDAFGEHKAVLALSNAMEKELHHATGHEDPSVVLDLTESQIRRRIANDLNGGSVALDTVSPTNGDAGILDGHHEPTAVKALLRQHVWWIVVFAAIFSGVLVGIVISLDFIYAVLVPVELAFVVYVGRSRRSRMYLAFCIFWYFCVRSIVPIMLVMLMSAPRKARPGFG